MVFDLQRGGKCSGRERSHVEHAALVHWHLGVAILNGQLYSKKDNRLRL